MYLKKSSENQFEFLELMNISETIIQDYFQFIKSTSQTKSLNDTKSESKTVKSTTLSKKDKAQTISVPISKEDQEIEIDELSYKEDESFSLLSYSEDEERELAKEEEDDADGNEIDNRIKDNLNSGNIGNSSNFKMKNKNEYLKNYNQNQNQENNENFENNEIKSVMDSRKIKKLKENLNESTSYVYKNKKTYNNNDKRFIKNELSNNVNHTNFNYDNPHNNKFMDYFHLNLSDWVKKIDENRYFKSLDTSMIAIGILKIPCLKQYKTDIICRFLEKWKDLRNQLAHDKFNGISKDNLREFFKLIMNFIRELKSINVSLSIEKDSYSCNILSLLVK